MTDVATLLDAALEVPVAPSFTKIGFEARRRLFHWTDLDCYDLHGRVIAVTGATSGLGRAAAEQLARDGATVIVLGRDATKTERVVAELRESTGNDADQRGRRRHERPGVGASCGRPDPLRARPARCLAAQRGRPDKPPRGCARRHRADGREPGRRTVPPHRPAARTLGRVAARAGDHRVVGRHVHRRPAGCDLADGRGRLQRARSSTRGPSVRR